jgi:Bacterial Ig-like domain
MFGKRIARALGLAAVMTMGFANAQTCTPTSPRLDSGTTFAAFNELERLEVRSGKAGTADWEWGVGKNTQTTGQFTSGNLDWVSGRTLDWTLTYASNGSATLTVNNGYSQSLSLSYASAPNGMRSGNALKFYAKTTADAGEAKVYVVPKSINGKEITGELETKGNGTLSEKSLFYYFPAMSTGFVAKGTVKFTFEGTAPPQGSRMSFLVTAGNITCGTTTDTTAPTISGQAPNNLKLNTATPAIAAQYADAGTGIDTTKVTLLVDGTNVTAQATVSATGVTYTPATALTNGTHTVQLNVADKANNPAQASWSFTVDTQLPTISGQSPNNIAVNTAKPTISAQYADAGTGIDLTKTVLTVDGATVTGQATATGISYVPATALAAGTHNVTLKVFDQAGNTAQSAWTFSVDVVGPVISALVPANAATIGNNRPAISAQYADAGAGIDTTKTVLTVDGVNVTAQATATATGISYTPVTALTSGAHAVVLKVFDKAGNTSQSTWTFTVSAVVTDTTPPTISGQAPNGLSLNSATPVISAQYADTGTGVDTAKVTLLVDGVNVSAQATISATGVTYTPTTALANGNHTVQLNIADKANNPAQASWSFTVDTQLPAISGQTPNNTAVNTTKPTIAAQYADAGTGIDTTKTVFTVDGVNVTAQATATATGISYTPSTALASGAHTIVLKVFDKAGNTSQSTWTFTVSTVVTDTTTPTISGQAPNNLKLNTATPAIAAQYADAGTGIDTTKVTLLVDGTNVTAQATVSATGVTYTPATALANGAHTVQLNIADKANNPAQASWSFTVDTQVPTISGQSPNNSSVNSATPAITAQYADIGTGIDLTKTVFTVDGANVTAQATATATGISYTPATALAVGAHTVSLKVFDQAGNSTQATWTFSVDIAGPVISAQTPANDAIINNTQPAISAQYADQGAGIDTAKTLLTVDGINVTAQAAATASGISFTPAAQLTSGAHAVVLKVFDKAGNSSQASWSFSIDNGAPVISGQTPKDVSINNAMPTVSSQYALTSPHKPK